MANTVQLKKDGQIVYPVTDVSLIIGLQDAIKLPPIKTTTLPTASAETAGKMYYVGPDANDEYERYITSAVNGSYEWIDLGGTEIPLPSIADNLTTDDANTALSAKQGKILNEEVEGLEAKVTENFQDLEGDTLYISDGDGNVIAKFDENGISVTDVSVLDNGNLVSLFTLLADKVDKDGAKVLSDENFTTALKGKLESLKNIDSIDEDSNQSTLYVTDTDENVIAKIDREGIESVDLKGAGRKMSDMPIPWYNDVLYITDAKGNVILMVDENGIKTVGFDSSGKFSQKFSPIQANGIVLANGTLKTNRFQIEKDTLLSVLIDGVIENVLVGVGKTENGNDFNSHWLDIDQTTVKLYRYVSETQLVGTYNHGITFTGKTTVVVDSKIVGNTKETTLKIFNDLGGVFTQSLPSWGAGACFVTNNNQSSSLAVSLSFMPKSLTKKVWMFGDSYVNFLANNRWPYYLAQLGHTDFFSNNIPGLSPVDALASLEYLLALGYVPSILVWCLGMNGDGHEEMVDGNYVINSYQKNVIDSVLAVCKSYGIIPILSTIPTVPSLQKTGLCNYVRSLGVRYIDFAEAVGADSSGNWNTGLLSEDGVHPSTLGARVLASRAFVDCPELSVID